jgi:hypothetical protein
MLAVLAWAAGRGTGAYSILEQYRSQEELPAGVGAWEGGEGGARRGKQLPYPCGGNGGREEERDAPCWNYSTLGTGRWEETVGGTEAKAKS